MGKSFVICRIQLKFRFWLRKKPWRISCKFQFEKTSNKKCIAKKPLTNIYEMNSSPCGRLVGTGPWQIWCGLGHSIPQKLHKTYLCPYTHIKLIVLPLKKHRTFLKLQGRNWNLFGTQLGYLGADTGVVIRTYFLFPNQFLWYDH